MVSPVSNLSHQAQFNKNDFDMGSSASEQDHSQRSGSDDSDSGTHNKSRRRKNYCCLDTYRVLGILIY
jgi:hypothetical protein